MRMSLPLLNHSLRDKGVEERNLHSFSLLPYLKGMRKAREEEMSSFSGFLISFNLFIINEWRAAT